MSKDDGQDRLTFENILVDEGLELLAAYRSITDRETRLAVKRVVVAISMGELGSLPRDQSFNARRS